VKKDEKPGNSEQIKNFFTDITLVCKVSMSYMELDLLQYEET
jgi:hypothetical protein